MDYFEILPDNLFSNHVESYWYLESDAATELNPLEILLPTCTFNIIFSENPCEVKDKLGWEKFAPGPHFFGQRNSCLMIKSSQPIRLFGIRFKPFAFSQIVKTPIYRFNDTFLPLGKLIEINSSTQKFTSVIQFPRPSISKLLLLNDFMADLLRITFSVDERLRAQLNYIMERKGQVQIKELFTEFETSKVTLRKHFINKVGLAPKKVAQIWRMNHFLDIKSQNPERKLTALSLEAGFYDQAHFNREFKQLFGLPPRTYLRYHAKTLEIAQENISKRFSKQYDPK